MDSINWTQVVISLCSILITGVLIPLIRSKWQESKEKLSKDQQDTIKYWTEVGVRWAKQWLQSETGEKRKSEVMLYVSDKLHELGIEVTAADLDKIVEATYEQVKKEESRKAADLDKIVDAIYEQVKKEESRKTA